ncbi:MAG: glycosyltransferase family 9 protein [Mariprofundales bacterium]
MRALVVVCRYLGDVLLATPLAQSLAAAGYEVEWLVAPGCEALLTDQTFARQVHTLVPSLIGLRDSVRDLRGQFDVACVITGSDRATAVARLAAQRVYAVLPSRMQDGWKRQLVTGWVSHDSHSHMVRYNGDLARLAGVASPHEAPSLQWCDADEAVVQQQLAWDSGEGAAIAYVHLHPFARWQYKLWPDAFWQQLMRRLVDHGLRLVISAGPNEVELARRLVEGAGVDSTRIRVLAGCLSWPQLAALSAKAALYVGLDTANTHLAAASGASVVALYGPTDPRIWGPWPAGYDCGRSPYRPWVEGGVQRVGRVTLMQSNSGCVPCQQEGCDHHRGSSSDCLSGMTVDRVWQACEAALA